MRDTLKRYSPNLVTFTGLAFAFLAVILAMYDEYAASAVCILAGYLLDAVDGAVARRLGVASDFGLQLDSLVDSVTFGVAPAALLLRYLRQAAFHPVILWIACMVYLMGGIGRLARFNLLPTKQSSGDSMGLTISTSGSVVALSVLSNRTYGDRLIPDAVFLGLIVLLTLLMVSRIRFPELGAILRRRWLSMVGLGGAAVLSVWLSPQLVWLLLTGVYVSFGLLRAAYGLVF